MKFKTFRGLVVGAVLVGGGAGGYALLSGDGDPPPPTTTPVSAPAPAPAATPPPAAQGGQPFRDIDRRILARLGAPLADGKGKDVFKSEAVKVNLYQDAGHALPNRVKIDLDRDDRWDEKWTISGEEIVREVSPADDDQTYTERWRRAGERWVTDGPPPAEAPPPPPEPARPASNLREVDTETIALARRGISGDRVKDATPGKPWKVSLYRDAGESAVNRAKIDLDRDDRWDEKWTFAGEEIKRQVAPADDEVYSVEFRLRAGAWVPK